MASRSPAASSATVPLAARIRAWRRIAAMAALLGICVPLHGLWRLCGLASPWPRVFLGLAGRASGCRTIVLGQPLARDVLIVANHLTWLDILIVAGATGARFVAKAEIAGWPYVGFLAGLNRTVYVARAERGRVAEQAGALRAAIAERTPVALFAEGGTSDGTGLRPFRASLFAALLPPLPGVRVQPLAIDYGDAARAMAWQGDTGFGTELFRLLTLPGTRTVSLRFLSAIDPAALPDRKALAAAAHAAIAGALHPPL